MVAHTSEGLTARRLHIHPMTDGAAECMAAALRAVGIDAVVLPPPDARTLELGARHLTGVDTVEGDTAWETQLMKAFSSGGLQFADQVAPPPPPKGGDAEALARWAKQSAPPAWKVRVDAGAKTPCPT